MENKKVLKRGEFNAPLEKKGGFIKSLRDLFKDDKSQKLDLDSAQEKRLDDKEKTTKGNFSKKKQLKFGQKIEKKVRNFDQKIKKTERNVNKNIVLNKAAYRKSQKHIPVYKKLFKQSSLLNLANLLTFSRLFVVCIIFVLFIVFFAYTQTSVPYYSSKYFIFENNNILLPLWLAIGILYFLGIITDFLDGFFARKYNLVSNFGKLFDPLSDKFLNIIILISFTILGIIPFFFTLPLICRDFYVTFLRGFAHKKNIVIKANNLGKIATGLFAFSYILIFFFLPLYGLDPIQLGVGHFIPLQHIKWRSGWFIYLLLIPFYFALIASFAAMISYNVNFWKNNKVVNKKYQ